MKRLDENDRVSASQLGLRELPKSWRGATLRQLISSAERVVEQSEAVGGSQDPRLLAAIKILGLAAQKKGAGQ
jgi:hypothetical protein